MTDEMIALRKEYERAAFKRGAEAMRESAAFVVESADDGVPLQCLADDGIRALPTPEYTDAP